jgi:predicted outer membrane repeat protein
MNKPRVCISLTILGVLVAACNTPTPTPHIYTAGCSPSALIAAIGQANAVPGPTVINLAVNCEYKFTSAYDTRLIDGVTVASALPPITSDIKLVGNNAVLITNILMGFDDPHFGLILIQPEGLLRTEHLTIQNGWRPQGGAVFINRGSAFFDSTVFHVNFSTGMVPNTPSEGGAIYNRQGSLTIAGESHFLDNVSFQRTIEDEDTAGGGILNSDGFLLVVNSTFEGNRAHWGGAISIRRSMRAEGREGVIISGGEFRDNASSAIYAEGERTTFVISTSSFTQNKAKNGGAIRIKDSILDLGYSVFSENSAETCGALDSFQRSELTISNTEFSNNTAEGSGGALCHDGESLKIDRAQFLSNQAGGYGGGIYATRPFSARNTTFDSNVASENGGGVFAGASADIDGSTFSENHAFRGGGLYAGELPDAPAGPDIDVAIRQSTFSANGTQNTSGYYGGTGTAGGGIAFAGKELTIDQSAIWRNASVKGAGVYGLRGKLKIVNSTISTNLGGEGAGLYLEGSTNLSMDFTSIIDNQANPASASVVFNGPSTIQNTIVEAFPGSSACQLAGPGPYLFFGANLDTDGTCTGFSMTVYTPWVDTVPADNGGPTYTNRLWSGSPAVDAGDCHGVTVDQRGQPRPYGARCDLGAFELGANNPNPPPPPLPDNPLPAVTETPPASQGLCEYRAIQNANCRAGDDARTSLVAVLTQGEVVKLLSLNPELTHGLFEIPDGRSCWVWLPLMEGPPDPRQSCNVTIVDPPEYVPETPACSADLPKDQCEAAGGTMSDGVTSAPHCICPQQESAASPSSGPRFASCAAARERSGDPSAGPEGLGSRFSVLWPVVF